ncbi:MAG: two pore domain potassium channel family protein [Eggerthellaceae bacterium]|nr:two pore domain potassium channel family protein [Eggerthellaceae bacterium]
MSELNETHEKRAPKPPDPEPLKFRAIGPVIRAAGLVPWAIAFVVLFLVVSLIVSTVEPAIGGFANAAWLMFQVVTTIGLGDFTCTSIIGRVAAIVLSVYSVFFLALITGAVVTYCSERMNARRDASVAQFLDRLEHLPELSHDELAALSEQVKRFDKRWK